MDASVAFALAVGRLPPEALRVQRFTGREGVNELYRFDIELVAPLPPAAFEPLVLGQRACFVMRTGGRERAVHGIIAGISAEGVVGGHLHLHRYRLRLVPRAWLLTRRKGSRIFGGQSADQVLGAVLAALDLGHELRLPNALPEQEFLTQYEESDFDFLRRLCAENGLAFYFEQPALWLDAPLMRALAAFGELLTLTDVELFDGPPFAERHERLVVVGAADYPPQRSGELPPSPDHTLDLLLGAPSLHFRDAGALAGRGDEWVVEARLERRIRPNTAAYREFDPSRPLALLEASATLEAGPDEPSSGELTLYEHSGRHKSPNWGHGQTEPRRMLERARRRARLVRGKSVCSRVEAGHRFRIDDHPLDELRVELATVSVRHRGAASFGAEHVGPAYENTFVAVPAEVPYVAALPRERPVLGCLTAIVVGTGAVDTDTEGRVQVRFHWDRSADGGGGTTCWLRSMQPWGGNTLGTQLIPRVGSEVVVMFEGGDPDRPLVVGTVPNAVNPLPFPLPAQAARSGIRTRSIPTGEGYNELSFDDTSGVEQVRLRAERDLDVEARGDRTAVVGHDDSVRVGGSRTVTVAGAHHREVGGHARDHVEGDHILHVAGSTLVSVERDRVEKVHGTRRVEADRDERTVGEVSSEVQRDVVQRVHGSAAMLVGSAEGPGSISVTVEGTAAVSGSKVVDIHSADALVLRSGDSFIRVSPGGVEIAGPSISVRSGDARLLLEDGEAKLKATSWQVVTDDTIVLKSSSASLALASEAKLDGSRVLLNSPEAASDSIETSSPEVTTIELVDQDGDAIPYRQFVVRLEDGRQWMGFLDAAGKAEVDLTGSGKIEFPGLADVEAE